jgi:hypothetical protein
MLTQLPEEILWLISGQLDDQIDRLNLATSCQQLYGELYPTVFRKIRLCGWYGVEWQIEKVAPFFYTVVRNPKLASMVQELNLGSWDTRSSMVNRGSPDCEFDRDLMERLLREASTDTQNRAEWMKDLEDGVTDAWLALLIPRLTNLHKISLVWNHDASYVYKMLEAASKSKTPVFPHLEEAWGAHWDTEMGTDTDMMKPFFKFHTMRKIGGFMLYEPEAFDDEEEEEEEGWTPRNRLETFDIGFSNITDIDLRMTNVADGLQSWIRACKALKSFRLAEGGSIVSYAASHREKLYSALSDHKTTLQAVSITNDPDHVHHDEEDNPPKVSFAEFTSLEILHAPCADVVGLDTEDRPTQSLPDVLPPSLKILSLCFFYEDLYEWLIEQCDRLLDANVCPNLESICLESYVFGAPDMVRKADELKRRCHESGVALQLFKVESSDAFEYWESIWPLDHEFNRD